MGAVQMASHLSAQGLKPVQQFPSVVPGAADVDLLPLRAQVTSPSLVAGLEAAAGQDYGLGMDVHKALRCLRPHALDTPVGGGQEVNNWDVIDHVNTPPLGSPEQPVRQARAAAPELDHSPGGKVDATSLSHRRLIQLEAHSQALHPPYRLVGVVYEHAGQDRVSLTFRQAHNIVNIGFH